jgi:hypothetical protein
MLKRITKAVFGRHDIKFISIWTLSQQSLKINELHDYIDAQGKPW